LLFTFSSIDAGMSHALHEVPDRLSALAWEHIRITRRLSIRFT
jgi:hypothetical protein